MHVLYRITYLPHLNLDCNPKYYIGSKHNYCKSYLGSPSSNQEDWFTNGLSIREWWKNETLLFPEKFQFEIFESYDNITTFELVEKEYELHVRLEVLGDEYFNKAYATKGWVGVKKTDHSKEKASKSIKEYWDNTENENRREKLRIFNRETKGELLKKMWADGKFDNRPPGGRPKGSKDKTKRIKQQRKIMIDGEIFENAFEAAKKHNIDPVNIRRRCRMDKFTNWRYL